MAEVPYTLMRVAPFGMSPFSVRGVNQSLELISAALNFRRTVNGKLVKISPAQFTKYKASVTCTDMDSPAVTGRAIGAIVVFDSVVEISYITLSGDGPERPVVPGSERVEGELTFYRPQMTMMIVGFNINKNEWGASVSYQIDMEEE